MNTYTTKLTDSAPTTVNAPTSWIKLLFTNNHVKVISIELKQLVATMVDNSFCYEYTWSPIVIL